MNGCDSVKLPDQDFRFHVDENFIRYLYKKGEK